MTHECPDCGETLTLSERTVRLRVGVCPDCHQSFTFVPHPAGAVVADSDADGASPSPPENGATPVSADGSPSEPSTEAGAAAKAGGEDESPVCGTCGSDLTFRAADDVTIEVFCATCDETTR